ncbi:MAG: AAA family ATPase [Sedimentisphaerales bacterium]|nr:AAA family ATPase [Sedimentisphaerales bacterium]
MRTIAVLNQKGGVGKTTTTVNAAAALATMGQRVVVIDLDPQAHLTIHLGIEPQEIHAGSYEVLTQSASFEESLMLVRPNLWALAANINLVGAETELVSVVGREIILREAMQASAERFDFCLIDCAPSLGLLSLNALAAAQEVLIPLQPHFLALQGFGKLLQTVDLVNKRINRELKVTGVLLCMFDTRASLPNEVRADVERFLENARGSASAWADAQLLPTFIRRNIKLAEAPSYGRTIFEYDPNCNGAEDYQRVAQYFLGIEPEVTEARVESAPEPEIETPLQPVGANHQSPSASEVPGESEPAETSPEPAPQPEASVTSEQDESARAERAKRQDSLPPASRELEPEPSVEHEIGGEHAVETEPNAPSDIAEPGAESERNEPHLPPVAEAELPVEADPIASPPAPVREESESETADEVRPENSAPIEIRAIHAPVPRRYSPPPLQRFPVGPSSRDESQRDTTSARDAQEPDQSGPLNP